MIYKVALLLLSLTPYISFAQTMVDVYYTNKHIYSYDKDICPIYFYDDKTHAEYFPLTNFYPNTPFYLDGKLWQTSEHYYQAHKFLTKSLQEIFRALPTPDDARNRAITLAYRHKVRSDWHNLSNQESTWDCLKAQTMYKAVKAKFDQHDLLCYMLLQTGYANLVENDGPFYNQQLKKRPSFWGNGKSINGETGKNMMGQILMRIRYELQKEQQVHTKT